MTTLTTFLVIMPSDPTLNLSLLHNFRIARNSSRVHERAAMKLLQHFMKDPAEAIPRHRLCTTDDDGSEKVVDLIKYCQIVN